MTQESWTEYRRLSQLALNGERQVAGEGFGRLLTTVTDASLQARIHNDLGVIAGMDGQIVAACQAFDAAIRLAPEWSVPQENRRQLEPVQNQFGVPPVPSPQPCGERARVRGFSSGTVPNSSATENSRRTRVAILSLLFNWPSIGGGTVHTAETGKFLAQAGYEVRHFYAQFSEWGLGNVTEPPLAPSQALVFTPAQWTVPEIQARFRAALKAFEPDWVIITDSWNSKPLLAHAARDYKFLLRIAAQECLCPLNNVRLLYDEGRFHSCPKHQLATPADCCECVFKNGKFSGGLHQAERELVNYGTNEYDSTLRWAFANAEAVLVVNPLIGAMVSPYAKKVCVIPSGFDSARFPKAATPARRASKGSSPLGMGSSPLGMGLSSQPVSSPEPPLRILFAGLIHEIMKGFEVIHESCRRLWNERQDFELLATADPPGQLDEFTRYIGWQSQAALPGVMSEADIVGFPTIAEEALGRTAVEAMGAGRPVVASRIGGLQFTIVDGATGLLFEPGNVNDLCSKLNRLLDDAELRERFGAAGRERFEEHYSWESILAKHYLPLLGNPVRNR